LQNHTAVNTAQTIILRDLVDACVSRLYIKMVCPFSLVISLFDTIPAISSNNNASTIEDISSAYFIYQQAQQQNIGTTLNLY
jgi:hypothetical protein